MEDRTKNLYELLTEDFVIPAANFYMNAENREKFYELWGQFKKTLEGYTRQPESVITEPKKRPDLVFPTEYYESESSQNKVEAMAKWLYEDREPRACDTFEELVRVFPGSAEIYRQKVREILKLFPEPVLDNIIPSGQLLSSAIAYELGVAQGKYGNIWENYPENFNAVLAQVGEKIREWLVNPSGGKYTL